MKLAAIQPQPQQPVITLTLESTSLWLTILISISALLGVIIQVITRFNNINAEIRDLREDLNSHSSVIKDVKVLQLDLCKLDKKIDIHLQDYVNHKDSELLTINGIKEKIEHKWHRTEEELEKRDKEIEWLKQQR